MFKFSALLLILSGLCIEAGAVKRDWLTRAGQETPNTAAITKKATSETPQSSPHMVVENQDGFPAPDHLTFSNVQAPWSREGTPQNRNHDKVKLRISNRGTGDLIVTDLKISDGDLWKIDRLGDQEYKAATDLPLTVKAGASETLTLEFIAKNQSIRVTVLHGSLHISSNDDAAPEKEVKLHGLWQRVGEGNNEPYAQEIINAFGFKTNTGYEHDDGANKGESAVPGSDEIISSFFVRADPSRPVEVIQMAAYHGCCSQVESFRWYEKGASSTKTLFTHNGVDGQSLLPRKSGSSSALAKGSFSPGGAFGFRVGSAYSDRTRNDEEKLGMRIWKAIDAGGNVIPNAYIIGTDYLGTDFTNYDYQDNVYFVRNIRPETGTAYYSELAAAPSAVHFSPVQVGRSAGLTVALSNLGKTYGDGSSDPSIQIARVEIVGPDRAAFAAAKPAATQLAVQTSVNMTVEFRPISQGLKNAALLVYFTNGASPLRIPLYGTANGGGAAITAVRRIKGAANANVTIGGNVWEADKAYRKGSIKLDKQVVTTPIAATDDDELYQTYLSAEKDLAETSYEIPLENGTYTVRMHFAENYWSAEADRIFDIYIEDQLRLQGLDIYKEIGYRTAMVKDFEVSVAGGILNINFDPSVNRVAIAGLEIFKSQANVTGLDPATLTEKRRLVVYPNPGEGDEVQIVLEHFGSHEPVTVTMHDILGKVVYSKSLQTDAKGSATAPIAVAALHKGVYIVKVEDPEGEVQSKLLVK
ncbi:malectin domain-containing carbohydrate-binding protein [Pontibacter russatus]|uniref:malectin domain-containing carbohydrate-binding protein n=1 Tax=Pontibacter russatus TaxID=2694929 RepID=UPI00137B7291|nr:malectin domain-containing carbohydrate-binding protein [Pontibacter russatus]